MGRGSNVGKVVLVLNAGSSSLKFKVFSTDPLIAGMGGMFDRIGDTSSSMLVAKGPAPATMGASPSAAPATKKWELKIPVKDHVSAMQSIMSFLKENVSSTFEKDVKAVGHRIVHGLDLSQPTLLDDAIVDKIKQAAVLAPLHNPPGLQGITAAQQVFKGVPQVGREVAGMQRPIDAHTRA